MKMELLCKGYQTTRRPGEPPTITAEFVLVGFRFNDIQQTAAALHDLEIYLGSRVELVKATPQKQRCFYCGSLNDEAEKKCTQCGASL